MTAIQRFCEECGNLLIPGKRFCEECGYPIPVTGSASGDSPAPLVPLAAENVPLAVIPFAYQHSGVFSIDRFTLVVYPDQVIFAFITKTLEKEYDQAMIEVQATLMEKHLEGKSLWQLAAGTGFALFKLAWSPVDFYTADAIKEEKMLRNITIPTRPWERYLSMCPDAVLAENGKNMAIRRESIAIIRGESDPSTSTDQILLFYTGGFATIFFEFGIFHLARKVLFSFLLPTPSDPEKIIGVIPNADEPQVEGFGFQYSWNLVITDNRLIFCMIEDDFADEATEWIEKQVKEAKKSGRTWRMSDAMELPGSPWLRLMNMSISSLLENEVNFFIPLPIVNSVQLVPGGPGQADELCFFLPGEPYDIVFPNGTAGQIQAVLGAVLAGRWK
jgi:hypothetical protein